MSKVACTSLPKHFIFNYFLRQSDDSKEPPKEDFDEEIHIEIEPVDDHVVNTTPRKDDDDEIVKTDDDQDHNSKKD